ncbi:TPA: ShlB/FhaC/HecB family hemolysin secretion/activation protein [Escherichia coli]|nr:ShlB/FhaC/HecB family hemolysin secretion/activation protein [Escherichia coli]HBC1013074.1 ShlB/FhaC/HecB family hemolysin secretion/activation protein [Escherichia coli]
MFSLSVIALIVIPALSAQAAVLPGAGTIDNQLRQNSGRAHPVPGLSTPDVVLPVGTGDQDGQVVADNGARVVLDRIQIDGERPRGTARVSEAAVKKLTDALTGRPVSFGEIRRLTTDLTALFRRHGALLARVIIPPQTIRNGVLTLTLIPGEYGTSAVDNRSALRDNWLQRIVAANTTPGEVVTKEKLERLSLLVNEVPGLSGKVSLTQGDRTGTTSVHVTAENDRLYGGWVGADNLGIDETGRSRIFAGVYAGELLGTGDQLRAEASLAYEDAGLTTGSIDYSMLVSGQGTRAGAGYSRMDYRYDFMSHRFRGYADTWQVYVSHPLVRTARAQVNVRATAGQSLMTDKYPSGASGIFQVYGDSGRKTATKGGLGVDGSLAWVPGGVTGVSLSVTQGHMDYRDEAALFWSGADIRRTEGHFSLMNWLLRHEQQVWGPFSLFAQGQGQVSQDNLDPSQKFVMGGPYAVRAYDTGTGYADNGTVVTAELRSRWALPSPWSWTGRQPALTVAGFWDQGWGEQNKNNISAYGGHVSDRNRVELAGAGVYVTLADEGNYAATVTWAHRTGREDPVSGYSDDDRVWLSAMKTF